MRTESGVAARVPAAGARRREPWPFVIVGLLACMGAVLLTLLRLATSHADAVVVDDAYGAGQRINAELAARARVAELGWRLDLEAAPEGAGVRVRVRLHDAAGAGLAAERVSVRRERPAEGGLDQEIALARDGDAFVGLVPLPRRGLWWLEARAERAGETVLGRYGVDASP